jgi:hypothetical protein
VSGCVGLFEFELLFDCRVRGRVRYSVGKVLS